MVIPGKQKFHAAEVDSAAIIESQWPLRSGRHYEVMATGVIQGAEAASVSFPEFWDTLAGCTSR